MTLRKKYSKIRKCVIYEIVCNITGERYIGSTLNYSDRKYKHKIDIDSKKKCESGTIIKRGNFNFNKLETFYCLYELSKLLKEQYYLDNLNNINKQRAFTLIKRYKYRNTNQKKYAREHNKIDYERHKDKRKLTKKIWRETNKKKIKEKVTKKYTCKCGREVRSDSKWRHEKTKIHKKNIDNIINE